MPIPWESICSLGVGGALGFAIFLMYRMDKKHTETTLKDMVYAEQKTREKHTEVLTELTVLLKKMNGRH